MSGINDLTEQLAVVSSDQFPLWSVVNGQSRKASASAVAAFVAANLPAISTPPVVAFVDSTGTPGNVTNNSPRGRVAFAAGASTVVVTNSTVTANSMIKVTLRTADGALTSVLRALPATGLFTITANAASTGTAAQADYEITN